MPKSFLSVAFDKSRLFKSQFAAAVPKQVTQINALVIEQGYCELGGGALQIANLWRNIISVISLFSKDIELDQLRNYGWLLVKFIMKLQY